MTLSRDTLETGFALLGSLVDEEPALQRELASSRSQFFGPAGAPADDPTATRRHLEWFLLERPSEFLEGVPVEAWLERWAAAAGAIAQDQVEALLNSRAGAYEVTGVQTGHGVWLQDLLTGGEYPVEEPEAAEALTQGDLVVGRLFPVGDTIYRLSPAAACFRNPTLVEALRNDMEALRAGRRGTLRIQQSELERMFHTGAVDPAAAPADVDPDTAAERARQALVDAGAPPDLAGGLVGELAARAADPGSGAAVAEALDRLAFDTDTDLEVARRELVELWGTLRAAPPAADAPSTAPTAPAAPPARNGGPKGRPKAGPPQVADDAAPPEAVQDALRRFDEARAGGADLDQIFDTLERDLGLDTPGDDETVEAPDFPGVVGAMVEEFLWESERESGSEAAARLASLRDFGSFTAPVGVFENLGRRELLDYTTRHLLDNANVDGPKAHTILAALGAFCRWSEERHEVALWTAFGSTLEVLARSVPRLADARRHVSGDPRDPRAELFSVDRDGGGELLFVDLEGEVHRPALLEALDARLRPGDLVRAVRGDADPLRVVACYPAELRELSAVTSDSRGDDDEPDGA